MLFLLVLEHAACLSPIRKSGRETTGPLRHGGSISRLPNFNNPHRRIQIAIDHSAMKISYPRYLSSHHIALR